jgi:hypothetical protein
VYSSNVYYNSISPLNSEEYVRSQVSLSGMCSTQSGTWAGFSSRTLCFPCHYYPTNVPLSLIRLSLTLYNLSKWQRRLITHLKIRHFTGPTNKRHSVAYDSRVQVFSMFLLPTVRKQKVRHLGVFQWYNFQSSDPEAEMGATKAARRSTDCSYKC